MRGKDKQILNDVIRRHWRSPPTGEGEGSGGEGSAGGDRKKKHDST